MDDGRPLRRARLVPPRRPRPRHPPVPHRPAGRRRHAVDGHRRDRGRPGTSGCACCRPPTTGSARWSPSPDAGRARSTSRPTSSAASHDVPVSAVRFDGAEAAEPGARRPRRDRRSRRRSSAPRRTRSSRSGPCSPCPAIREAVAARRDRAVAVSPIVAGAALKGPADRMLVELGHEASVVGVARLYRDWCVTLVVDEADADRAAAVEAEGVRCVVAPTRSCATRPAPPPWPAPCWIAAEGAVSGVTGLEVFPILGVPEVRPGDDLAGLIADAPRPSGDGTALRDGDVVVVTQKVVSKAEGKLERIDPDDPLATRRSSSGSRCGSSAGAATSSSPRPSTGSSAPTPASTCPTSRTAGPPSCPTTPTARPAACATASGPGPASRWR